MNDEEHWEDPIWRLRFKAYSPMELVEVAQRDTDSRVATLALEELDRKLLELGCDPRR